MGGRSSFFPAVKRRGGEEASGLLSPLPLFPNKLPCGHLPAMLKHFLLNAFGGRGGGCFSTKGCSSETTKLALNCLSECLQVFPPDPYLIKGEGAGCRSGSRGWRLTGRGLQAGCLHGPLAFSGVQGEQCNSWFLLQLAPVRGEFLSPRVVAGFQMSPVMKLRPPPPSSLSKDIVPCRRQPLHESEGSIFSSVDLSSLPLIDCRKKNLCKICFPPLAAGADYNQHDTLGEVLPVPGGIHHQYYRCPPRNCPHD